MGRVQLGHDLCVEMQQRGLHVKHLHCQLEAGGGRREGGGGGEGRGREGRGREGRGREGRGREGRGREGRGRTVETGRIIGHWDVQSTHA